MMMDTLSGTENTSTHEYLQAKEKEQLGCRRTREHVGKTTEKAGKQMTGGIWYVKNFVLYPVGNEKMIK